MFVLDKSVSATPEMDALDCEVLSIERNKTECDLTLYLEEHDTLDGFLEYNVDLFDRATIAQMYDRFIALLRQFTEDTEQNLPSLVNSVRSMQVDTHNAVVPG
jgi:non-ribosomal peptide synthetase component F